MPISTHWEDEGIYVILNGEITAEEMYASNTQIIDDPRSLKLRYQIVNALKATNIEIDQMTLLDLSADDVALSRKVRDVNVAMIVDNPKFRKIAEKYMTISWKLNSSWHFRIFDSEEEARDWIALDKEKRLV